MKKVPLNWTELSNDAVNVLEWIENPVTDKLSLLMLRIGEHFKVNLKSGTVYIPITEELYQEFLGYKAYCDEKSATLNFDIDREDDLITIAGKYSNQYPLITVHTLYLYGNNGEEKIVGNLNEYHSDVRIARELIKSGMNYARVKERKYLDYTKMSSMKLPE